MFSSFFLVNLGIYARTWENTVQLERPEIVTIRRMRFVRWIIKAADTH